MEIFSIAAEDFFLQNGWSFYSLTYGVKAHHFVFYL